jgi:hypothetical protein
VDEVQVLQVDLLNLRKRANTLNSPSTFSEYAKVKREITKKTEQLKQLMGNQQTNKVSILQIILRFVLRAVSTLIVVYIWWSQPIIALERDYLWPIGSYIYSSSAPYTIGALRWVVIVNIALAQLFE